MANNSSVSVGMLPWHAEARAKTMIFMTQPQTDASTLLGWSVIVHH
jgi:hypothetical protein